MGVRPMTYNLRLLQSPIYPSRDVHPAVVEDDAEDVGVAALEPLPGALGHFPPRPFGLNYQDNSVNLVRQGDGIVTGTDRGRVKEYPLCVQPSSHR